MAACNLIDRRIHLRVKIKSLAAEAGIIRFEERRQRGRDREQLHRHRVWEVRREQRASLLAYGYIRGREYTCVEPNARTAPSHKRIAELVATFGFPFGAIRDRQLVSNEVQQWLLRAGPCGRDSGVMTQSEAGSTPAARSRAG